MSSFEIEYKTNCALEKNIETHLTECIDSFVPRLDDYVIIKDYAHKLYARAINFESWIGNRLIGLLSVYMNPTSETAFVTNVSVVEAYSGNGIARELFSRMENDARKNDVKTIVLEVNKDNVKAIRFYERNFFQKSRLNGNTLEMKKSII